MILRITTIITILSLCAGCVAPGSMLGRVAISGSVESQDGEVPSDLRVTLPKHYGLGGLDLVMNGPEGFGHIDQTIVIEVQEGQFTHEFPKFVYHVSFWILPPLGAFPKQPPPPVYYVEFADAPNEIYLVGMDRGKFKYRVYDSNSRQEIDVANASWNFIAGEYAPVSEGDSEVWYLSFRVTKPNKSLNKDAQ